MEEIKIEPAGKDKMRLFYLLIVTVIAAVGIIASAMMYQKSTEMQKGVANEKIMMAANMSSLKSQVMTLQEQISEEKEKTTSTEEGKKFFEAKIKAMNEELDKISAEKDETDDKLKSLEAEKSGLEKKLEELKVRNQELEKKSVEKAEKGKEEFDVVLARKKAELDKETNDLRLKIVQKEDQIKQIKDEKLSAPLREELKKIQKDLEAKDATKMLIYEAILRLEDIKKGVVRGVELAPIKVQPDSSKPKLFEKKTIETAPRQGKIIKVYKEDGFVVVDLGKKNGLAIGEMLYVVRNGNNIAKLEVIAVREEISASLVKEIAKKISLNINDIVQ